MDAIGYNRPSLVIVDHSGPNLEMRRRRRYVEIESVSRLSKCVGEIDHGQNRPSHKRRPEWRLADLSGGTCCISFLNGVRSKGVGSSTRPPHAVNAAS